MTINDKIVVLANQIANKGKKPTVALIKAKLTQSVSLPTIISTLKTWQHDPSHIALSQSETTANEQSSTKGTNNSISSETHTLKTLINEELSQMKQEIVELKQLIQQVITQQNLSSKK